MRMRDLFTEDEGAAIKPTTSSRSDSYQTKLEKPAKRQRFQTPPTPTPKSSTLSAPPKPTSD